MYILETEKSQLYFYSNYSFALFSASIETLLIAELTKQIESKFTMINLQLYDLKLPLRNMANFSTKRIKKIMEAHYQLNITSRRLNDIFSFPIVVTIASNLCLILITLYYTIRLAMLPNNFHITIQMLSISLWTCMLLTQIVIISAVLTKVVDKVKHTINVLFVKLKASVTGK